MSAKAVCPALITLRNYATGNLVIFKFALMHQKAFELLPSLATNA